MNKAGATDPHAALQTFDDACAWYGPEMATSTEWLCMLDEREVAEIDAAVGTAQRSGVGLVALTERDFPLPRLGGRLKAIRADVLHGRGFVLIRGWPAGEHTL